MKLAITADAKTSTAPGAHSNGGNLFWQSVTSRQMSSRLQHVLAAAWILLITAAVLAPALARGPMIGTYDLLRSSGLSSEAGVTLHGSYASTDLIVSEYSLDHFELDPGAPWRTSALESLQRSRTAAGLRLAVSVVWPTVACWLPPAASSCGDGGSHCHIACRGHGRLCAGPHPSPRTRWITDGSHGLRTEWAAHLLAWVPPRRGHVLGRMAVRGGTSRP